MTTKAQDRTSSPVTLLDEDHDALLRLLRRARGFVLAFVRSNVPVESRRVVSELQAELVKEGFRVRELRLNRSTSDLYREVERLGPFATRDVVMVTGLEHSMPSREEHPAVLNSLNMGRELLRQLGRPLVFLLPDFALDRIARQAPDLWAWRSGVFETQSLDPGLVRGIRQKAPLLTESEIENLSHEKKIEHLEVLQKILADLERQRGESDNDRRDVVWRISLLLWSIGEADEALLYARKALTLTTENSGEYAAVQGAIGDMYSLRGEIDAALSAYQQAMAVFQNLDDVRSCAVTQGRIADILYDRGELDEALRIRREEELPVYERLGDVRSRAITQGRIADILYDRGELDEALRIRREEELSVYEKLGDVRSRAISLSQIADILYDRGELDEALRIRREEELPVFEKLGDVRSRAITLGKIADILSARGELDEALRIRQEEELPVYDKLGDVYSGMIANTSTALIYLDRNALGDRDRATKLLHLALFDAKRLGTTSWVKRIHKLLLRHGLTEIEPERPEPPSRL